MTTKPALHVFIYLRFSSFPELFIAKHLLPFYKNKLLAIYSRLCISTGKYIAFKYYHPTYVKRDLNTLKDFRSLPVSGWKSTKKNRTTFMPCIDLGNSSKSVVNHYLHVFKCLVEVSLLCFISWYRRLETNQIRPNIFLFQVVLVYLSTSGRSS